MACEDGARCLASSRGAAQCCQTEFRPTERRCSLRSDPLLAKRIRRARHQYACAFTRHRTSLSGRHSTHGPPATPLTWSALARSTLGAASSTNEPRNGTAACMGKHWLATPGQNLRGALQAERNGHASKMIEENYRATCFRDLRRIHSAPSTAAPRTRRRQVKLRTGISRRAILAPGYIPPQSTTASSGSP